MAKKFRRSLIFLNIIQLKFDCGIVNAFKATSQLLHDRGMSDIYDYADEASISFLTFNRKHGGKLRVSGLKLPWFFESHPIWKFTSGKIGDGIQESLNKNKLE